MPAPKDGGVDLAGTSACTRKLSRQPPGNVQRGRGARITIRRAKSFIWIASAAEAVTRVADRG